MNSLIDYLDRERMRRSVHSEIPTPLYHQVYSLLRKNIVDGTIEYGCKMPTEHELAELFDVSRITSKRAMDELASEGLVERRRGKGTHVIYKYEPKIQAATMVGDLQDLEGAIESATVRVLDVSEQAPPAEIRKELGLEEGAVAHRVIQLLANNEREPFAYCTSWTKAKVKQFNKRALESTPRYRLLRNSGVNIALVEQTISAELAGAEIARLLNLQPGDPLISMVRRGYQRHGALVDVLFGLYNPQLFHYRCSSSIDN